MGKGTSLQDRESPENRHTLVPRYIAFLKIGIVLREKSPAPSKVSQGLNVLSVVLFAVRSVALSQKRARAFGLPSDN
jgi:hypothetical protein